MSCGSGMLAWVWKPSQLATGCAKDGSAFFPPHPLKEHKAEASGVSQCSYRISCDQGLFWPARPSGPSGLVAFVSFLSLCRTPVAPGLARC